MSAAGAGAMEESDRVRLAKLLARTDSNHDGEALAAVRKANELIRRNRLRWDDFVAPPRPAERANPRPASREPPVWADGPLHRDFFRREDAFAHYRSEPVPPPEGGIAAFAVLAGSLLAFPLRRAGAYRDAFRSAGRGRGRIAIALAAPLAVLSWLAVCWAPPAALLALAAAAALPHPPAAPSKPVAQHLTAGEFAALDHRVAACWRQPPASRHVDLRATVLISMNPDATVRSAALARDPGSDPVLRRFAESAIAAVSDRRCQPFPLPHNRYSAWQRLTLTFVSRGPPPR